MASPIRVLLQDNVENLGQSGDVVRVRPGYARNYLIPRGLAVPATPGNLARVDQLKKQATARADQALSAAKELGDKLLGVSVKIERAVGEEGKMYGSITTRDIEEAFLEKGIELDKRKIQLSEPIKTLGEFQVGVKLQANVSATLRIEVVKKT